MKKILFIGLLLLTINLAPLVIQHLKQEVLERQEDG